MGAPKSRTRYRRRRVVNRQENVEPFGHPCQNSEPRCRSVALWHNLNRVRRTHHTFLEGGLESRPPFQLVSSIEFWSVVLTAFDQGASKSEPPSDGATFARSEPKKSNPASLGKDDVQKTRTLRAIRDLRPAPVAFFSNPSRAPGRKSRTLRRRAMTMCKKCEPSVPPICQNCIWAPAAKN